MQLITLTMLIFKITVSAAYIQRRGPLRFVAPSLIIYSSQGLFLNGCASPSFFSKNLPQNNINIGKVLDKFVPSNRIETLAYFHAIKA